MKKTIWNNGWEFTLDNKLDACTHAGITKCSDAKGPPERFYDYNDWERITLPHDWAVSLPKDPAADTFTGARNKTHYHRYRTERHSDASEIYHVGWYRKSFDYHPDWEGKRVFLEFEGIFRDATFWVNGVYMDRHLSGYTGFLLEITDQLLPFEENSVAVRVDSDETEGWWYEGAGIYRNVNLLVAEPSYLRPYETVIKASVDGSVALSALLVNDTDGTQTERVRWEILSPDGTCVAHTETVVTAEAYSETPIATSLKVTSPLLWHVASPTLYTLRITVGGETHEERFGFRSFRFDPDNGFFLNGMPLKLNGACVHQDFGGVGIALTDNLAYYKIARLKDMGVNAYRSAHHAPSPAIVRACDELGMLLMDETRMFGPAPEALRQLESLVKRDRNHASVFIWSIGNEEFSIQNTAWGQRMAEKVCRFVRTLDDTRFTTYGGNNGLHFEGINAAVDVRGVNYLHCGKIDAYHAEHPTQPIVGSEETSNVLSRGGAVNDLGSNLIDSSGTVTMPWGTTPKGYVKHVAARPWYMGAFMWTGFDYRGEPSPFEATNVSSSFGTIDLCGMEKPPFYYYKSQWTDGDVLKLTPHWNHKKGETVTVHVFTNCERVTLYLNGREIESRAVEPFDAPQFTLPFEKGTLTAVGVRNGVTLRDSLTTSGKTARITVTEILPAETENDIAILELSGIDRNGIPTLTASDRVTLSVKGGRIVGVGNGDPADYSVEQKVREEVYCPIRLFSSENGLYIVPERVPNEAPVTTAKGEKSRFLQLETKEQMKPILDDDYRLVYRTENRFEPVTYTYTTELTLTEPYEFVEFERLHGKASVYLDGKLLGDNKKGFSGNTRPFRFYLPIKRGHHTLKVTSELSDGSFGAMSGYVRLGRKAETPWEVRLHYGKARVFVKKNDPSRPVKLKAMLR